MKQDPNPTDYPHLEAFVDWLYAHVGELPATTQELIHAIQSPARAQRKQTQDNLWLKRWHEKHFQNQ